MAGDSKKLQPIIIKRVRKGGHGQHGGAWKIAYADFVTAMMAFFLLMWLLGSTTEGDKKGIADFFNSPLKVALLRRQRLGRFVARGARRRRRPVAHDRPGQARRRRGAAQDASTCKALKAEQKRAEIGAPRGAEGEGRGGARGEPEAGGDEARRSAST